MVQTQNTHGSPQHILARLAEARSITDKLFEVPSHDALYDRPIPERHRIVFYIGHLEAFDWNLLGVYGFSSKPFHPDFDKLFAFGIDPVDGGPPTDQPSDWPSLEEVGKHNVRVRQELDSRLKGKSLSDSDGSLSQTALYLNVAIERRLMHAETFAYMLHQLLLYHKVKQPSSNAAAAPLTDHKMIEIRARTATLGLPRTNKVFGWDNEFDVHSVHVPAFAIDKYNVTNGEFLKSLREGSYENRSLWSDPDWEWTSTVFQPFPRFEPFPSYRGYSTNFFDGKHYVVKGGSSRTAACMLRRSFRNWFQSHYQHVYSVFRCVSN